MNSEVSNHQCYAKCSVRGTHMKYQECLQYLSILNGTNLNGFCEQQVNIE